MDRTERLLDLVALLLDAVEPVPFAELRRAFPDDYGGGRESAERKLERDKAELITLGVPIEYVEPDGDHELGGYRVDRRQFFLPDPKLAPEEAAALYAAGAAALSTREFPFAQDLEHALRKISLAGTQPEAALAQAAARRLLIVRPGDPERAGKLRVLAEAVARKKRVHLGYRSPPGVGGTRQAAERTERDVDPWGLAFRGGAWRVVGYCHLRKAQRTFVVDRIEELRVNEQRPNSPDFEVEASFDAGAAAGKKPWQWAGAPPEEVTLRFAPGSEVLAERVFDAPVGETASLQVTYLDGLLPQVLSLGDRVRIESPPRARGAAVRALRELRARLLQPVAPPADPVAKGGPEALPPAQPDEPALAKAERLRRLLLIVPAVRKKPGILLSELAHGLGLDTADLRRDIDLLAMVGRPPFSPDDLIDISIDERDRVHVALDQSLSRPPQLTAFEALALAAAAGEVASAEPAVTSALAKLTDKLPASARQLYAALARRVHAASPPARGTEGMLARLRTAAEERRELVLEYDKEGRGAAEERTVHPQALIEHRGQWYVIGRDPQKQGERTFRVDRILSLRETSGTFAAEPVDPERFRRSELFFPTGAERAFVLRFSPDAAAWALWRYGSRARPIEGGRADVTVASAGNAYAISLALSLGGAAEIVWPPDARIALQEEVEKMLQTYGGTPA